MSSDANAGSGRQVLVFDSPLGDHALLVRKFEAREGLSELFQFRVELLSPRGTKTASATVPFEKLVGQAVCVRLDGETAPRYFHGIVRQLVRVENVTDKDFFHFEAEIVPTLWLWTRRIRSRVFQRQSVPDVLYQVFEGLRPDLDVELHKQYPKREYCVQYQESDFAFASRLMEDEGLSYFFRHQAAKHVLVVTDGAAESYKDLPEIDELRYDDSGNLPPKTERIRSWKTTRQIASEAFVQRDQHFELAESHASRPLSVLQETQSVTGTVALGEVTVPLTVASLRSDAEPLEIYEHNTGFAHRFEGKFGLDNLGDVYDDQRRVVTLRKEEETAQSVRVDASSTYHHLAPGYRFQLHGLGELDGKYALTGVTHVATQTGQRSGEVETLLYENGFTCVPVGLPIRPRRTTPKPRIDGVQTAIVVGAKNKAVDVDKYGRVKVQFYWDRGDHYNEESSCWIRAGQMWAGKRWGSFFWLRPGMEAIVAFEDGDPDRPLITGTVYNDANLPPFALPEQAVASGIVSCTLGGDAATQANALVFYDQPDDEHVQLHSETHDVNTAEAWKVTQAPAGHVEFAGSLNLDEGSGAGGGVTSWASNVNVSKHPHAKWMKNYSDVMSGKTTFVCGMDAIYVLGWRSTEILGYEDVNYVFDYKAIFWGSIASPGFAEWGAGWGGPGRATSWDWVLPLSSE